MSLVVTKGFGNSDIGSAFLSTGIVSTLNHLEIHLNETPTLSGPAADPTKYIITPLDGGVPATVTAVNVSGNNIELTTTQHTNGKNYQIELPLIGIVSTVEKVYQGPFSINYVGVGVIPQAILARAVDCRIVEITFSTNMNNSEALNPINYSILPLLSVINVTKILDSVYRITTSRQDRGVSYTITASNIHDMFGNLI